MNKVLSVIIISFLFTACTKSEESSNQNISKVNYDTLKIKISNKYLGNNAYGTTLYETERKTLFACYNHLDHAIEIYDLKNKKPVKKITLKRQGPNKLKKGSFTFLNDSIFLYKTQRKIHLIDWFGKIKKSISLNKIKNIDHSKFTFRRLGIHMANFDQLSIDTNQNFLLLPIYKNIRKKKYKKFHDSYFISKIYWNKNRGEIVPVKYPKIFRKKYFGDLDYPDFCIKNNSIIYSFRNSSNIYEWKDSQKKLLKYNIKCKNAKEVSHSLTLNNKTIIPTNKPSKYYRVIYDKHRNLFYRIYKEKNNKKNSKYFSGNYHLIILNNEFKKIKEIPLNKDIYAFSAHITKKGLIFALKAEKMEHMNCIRFLVMRPIIKN
jgi:hypothetical protein